MSVTDRSAIPPECSASEEPQVPPSSYIPLDAASAELLRDAYQDLRSALSQIGDGARIILVSHMIRMLHEGVGDRVELAKRAAALLREAEE